MTERERQPAPRRRLRRLRWPLRLPWTGAAAPGMPGAGLWPVVRLLPAVSAPLTVAVAAGVVVSAALPLGLTVATGALVGALPAAARDGWGSPAGGLALRALAVLAALFAADRVGGPARAALGTALGRRVDLHLEQRVIRAVNAPPGIGHLEDPAVLDRLSAAQSVGVGANTPGNAAVALANKAPLWLQGVAYTAVLARFSWWLALGLFAVQVATTEVRRREFLRTAKIVTDQSRVLRRAEYLRDLALAGGAAKELRVYGLAGWLTERYRSNWLASLADVWRAHERGDARLRPTALALAAAQAVVLGALGWAGARGSVGLGELTVYVGAVLGVAAVATLGPDDFRLAWGTAGVPAVRRLEALAQGGDGDGEGAVPDQRPAGGHASGVGSPPAAVPAGAPEEGIRFEGVTFRYPGAAADTFAGLELFVPAGRSLAVVGLNGAGKTTLVKLLCRLYDPQGGRVTVDGTDLRALDARAWQRRVAAIFQDFVQYQLPARDNIGFGAVERASAPDALEALREATRRAGALDVIESLARGWDTVLSRQYAGGAELSGGQWQRVALARALFAAGAGATVLVLDEPTANLDVRAEAALYDRFLEITGGLTTVLISHRFSTVRRADRICVLHGGRVAEEGPHGELLARGGRYAALFAQQAARFAETPTRG